MATPLAPSDEGIDTGRLRIPGAELGLDPKLYKWIAVIGRTTSGNEFRYLTDEEVANAAIALSFCAGLGLSVIDTANGSELITGIRIRGLSLRTLTLAKAKIANAVGADRMPAAAAARLVDDCGRAVGISVVISAMRQTPRGASGNGSRRLAM
jgi:hypothetical protein